MKKPAASKRANLPRRVDYARHFLKDWERLSPSGRYDMNRLKVVMLLLIANDVPLGPERRDHALKGSWAHYRECHIGDDFLLIYASTTRTALAVRFTLPGPARTRSCSNDQRQEHSVRLRKLHVDGTHHPF